MELIGSLVLAICGAALATLSSAQLRALGGRFSREEPGPPSSRPRGGGGKSDLSADTAGGSAPASTNSHPTTERAKSKPGQDRVPPDLWAHTHFLRLGLLRQRTARN